MLYIVGMITTKLSRRPLKRTIRFEIQLGPDSVGYRDGKERPRQCYVLWTSELPRGKKYRRFKGFPRDQQS